MESNYQEKYASRFETLGSRNLMEQMTGVRGKVDMYFGKVREKQESKKTFSTGETNVKKDFKNTF